MVRDSSHNSSRTGSTDKDARPSQGSRADPDATMPVASMVENIVGCKWSVRLLSHLADGLNRPSALLRACPGLSAKVMNERLRKMMRFGIVQRTVFGEKPPVEVEYLLTPFGVRFMKILDEVRQLQEAVNIGAISVCGEIEMEEIESEFATSR